MADLDDFFAKKDRKKGKSKKFPSEELARKIKIEDTSTTSQNQNIKKKDAEEDDGIVVEEVVPQTVEEDEWKDFQEEVSKDYTGLKIGNLQINDDDESGDADGVEYGSDGEINTEGQDKSKSGPWKKVEEGAEPQQQQQQQPQQPAVQEKVVYVSPALRNASLLKSNKTKKGVLPDINNVEFFPVLGSAKPEEVKKKRPEPGFEEVKHGGRVQRSTDLQANAPVSIGNRFGSLSDS